MYVIDDTVCYAEVHASFSNQDAISNCLKWKRTETRNERDERNLRPKTGVVVLPQTQNLSLVELLSGLETAGFMIADAFAQTRTHDKLVNKTDPSRGILYSVVVFSFYRDRILSSSNGAFKSVNGRGCAREALRVMCEDAMWRLTTFQNPFFQDEERVPGVSSLNFNLAARKPYYDSNNRPIAVWQKDENGERVGDAPVPISADYRLRFEGTTIRLVKA